MLREFVEKKHCLFAQDAPDWREAIRMSCIPLEVDHTVGHNYAEQIIDCIEKYGPYIVIMPDVAMPHSQENAEGVSDTAVSFMKLEHPVCFDEKNPELQARLFFTLASCDSKMHLKNMQRLSELLLREEVIDNLLKATCPDDLLRIQEKYLD